MKVIIAGSRSLPITQESFNQCIKDSGYDITEVVSGHSGAVDLMGELWADENLIFLQTFPADWKNLGLRAGPLRNTQMTEYADALIAFWNGKSMGTADMMKKMKLKGKPVYDALAKEKGEQVKYFFDTEFQEMKYPEAPMLISIGIVAEDGRELYGTTNFEIERCDQWVQENVVNNLLVGNIKPLFYQSQRLTIRDYLGAFLYVDPEPQFWAYYGAYDWFLLCQIFGGMMQLPGHWQETYYDLRVMLNAAGHSNKGQPSDHIHNALLDARWVKATWEQYLKGTPNG